MMTCKIAEPFHQQETLAEGQKRVTLTVVKESDIQLYKIFERSSGVSRFMTSCLGSNEGVKKYNIGEEI